MNGQINARRLSVLCALAALWLAALAASASAAATSWKFDCGTKDSPLMKGYERLTETDAYTAAKGYGWEESKPASLVFVVPETKKGFNGPGWPEIIKMNTTDLTCDGVTSADELKFRADVPNGTYRVTLTIGDLSKALGSIKVEMNGKVAADPASAWAPGQYRMLEKTPIGWWSNVRDTVAVQDGAIQIKLSKDQSYYDAQMAEQSKITNPFRFWWWAGAPEKDPPYNFIGYPFSKISVMGIEVVPDKPAPVACVDDKLSLTSSVASPALNEAISLFNEKKFTESLAALKKTAEPEAQAARAVVALWLAGRLEIESEDEIVPAALETLKKFAAVHPDETGVAEIVQDTEAYQKGITIHKARGLMNPDGVEKNHFVENDRAIAWLLLVPEYSPIYYKCQLYIARAAHMQSPYVPTLGLSEQTFKKLEAKFPDNRFVKYFLHWTWEPFGDGTHKNDWVMVDYASEVKDAPAWVQSIYPAWATLIDWGEWFIKFKQTPQGSIGGGSGDDVEIVGAFGYFGYTGRGVSDLLIPGAAKLVDWVYSATAVDPELGFCLPFADAEHSAEWTGDTLGMMAQIDYGNPLWIERCMKTGKLMRDLWTDYDKNNLRHFRANHFGAARVGKGDQANDSWINYRAIRPASAVLWYNNNPTIGKMAVELADAWVAAAMSTDRGKPKGVIPAEISFPDGLIGGVGSPNWYTASHGPGTVNYDFGGVHGGQLYKTHMDDLLMMAFEQKRDPKLFDPLRLEYELTQKYGLESKEAKGGRLQKVDTGDVEKIAGNWKGHEDSGKKEDKSKKGPTGEPGSEKWVAETMKNVEFWLTAKQTLEGRKGKLQNDVTKEEIVKYGKDNLAMVKARWPLMTTESSATDRTAFGGVVTPFLIYTGGRFGGPLLLASVTYENTGRQFAAAVMATDPQGFRILYYSLEPDEREIGIVPWTLEPGGTYTLTYGPDNNDDDVMDSVTETREFTLPQRGTPIKVKVKPRQAYVIEVDQTKRGNGPELAPDPGLSAVDIRFDEPSSQLLARIHNVGSKPVREVEVAAYDGDPKAGGVLIGRDAISNIEAPIDLEPRAVTIGFPWSPSKPKHDIYVVIDPDGAIKGEITTFNNVAHRILPEAPAAQAAAKPKPKVDVTGPRGRR